jgi:hypothetical protein
MRRWLHGSFGLTSSPPQKDGDSLIRRSMPRTEEDIQSRVDVTIMQYATLRTYPASYSEVCDTFRPRLACAKRTDSGGERFIDFLVPGSVRKRFVAEHVSEGRPARIENGLRHAGFGESGGIHIADRAPESSTFTRPWFKNAKSSARSAGRAAWDPPVILSPTAAKYRFRFSYNTRNSNKPHPQERHLLSGSNTGVSVPEKR